MSSTRCRTSPNARAVTTNVEARHMKISLVFKADSFLSMLQLLCSAVEIFSVSGCRPIQCWKLLEGAHSGRVNISRTTVQKQPAFPFGIALENCHHKDDPVEQGKLSDSVNRRARSRFTVCCAPTVGFMRLSGQRSDQTNRIFYHAPTAPGERPFFENSAFVKGIFQAGKEALLGTLVICSEQEGEQV